MRFALGIQDKGGELRELRRVVSAGSLLMLLEGKKREADAFFFFDPVHVFKNFWRNGCFCRKILTPLCAQWEICDFTVSITHKVSNMGTKGNDMGFALKLCVAVILKSKY